MAHIAASLTTKIDTASANGYDGSLMNGLQALHQWNDFMETPTGAWLGFMGAIYWVGNGICYAMSAWVANKYGRKLGIYIGYIFLVLGVATSAGKHDYYFVLMRFFVGCASAWFSGPVIALINEDKQAEREGRAGKGKGDHSSRHAISRRCDSSSKPATIQVLLLIEDPKIAKGVLDRAMDAKIELSQHKLLNLSPKV